MQNMGGFRKMFGSKLAIYVWDDYSGHKKLLS